MLREMTLVTSMMHAEADRALEEVSQNLLRYEIISLYGTTPSTVSHAARALSVSRQYVQRVTDDLREKGLVVARDNPARRGSPLLELSPAGRDLLVAADVSLERWLAHLGAALGSAEITQITAALASLRRAVESFQTLSPS